MEAERSFGTKSSAKRKPLTDLSNRNQFNLIPTSTLRKLCSSSSSTSSSSSLVSKKLNSNPNLNSVPKSKPDLDSKSRGLSTKNVETEGAADSSKSDTSIGSSNYQRVRNPSTSLRQSLGSTPSHVHPPPSQSPFAVPVNGDAETIEPLVVYRRRQGMEERKNKENVAPLPFGLPSPQTKEKAKSKGKAALVPFSGIPLGKTKNKAKAIAIDDKGKADALSSSFAVDRKEEKGKELALPLSLASMEKGKGKRSMVTLASSGPPLPRTKSKSGSRNQFNKVGDTELLKSFSDPHPKQKKMRRSRRSETDVGNCSSPHDSIEQLKAYFKEIDEDELLVEEVSDHEV